MTTPREIIKLGQLEIPFFEDAPSTDGRLSLFEFLVPPGARVPAPGLIGPAYFREIAAVLAAGGPPDPAKVAGAIARHGPVAAAG